jgi:hypothetical protein
MDASLKDAYAIALHARAQGRQFVRLEVEPKRRFMQRFVRLWDGAIGKTVGRRVIDEPGRDVSDPVVDMLIVEVGVTDVIEAFRRASVQDADRVRRGPESIAANKFSRPQKISMAR